MNKEELTHLLTQIGDLTETAAQMLATERDPN